MSNDTTPSLVDKPGALETALHIRGVLVLRQLVQLERTARESPFDSQTSAVAYIHREISRAITQCAIATCDRPGSDEHAGLRTVIDAEAAIDAIGREPAVISFLIAGSKLDVERYRASCRMLMILLDVPTVHAPRVGDS